MSLVSVKSADELEQEEQEKARQDVEAAQRNEPVLTELASHIKQRWHAALRAKQSVYDTMIQSLRQREGVYSQEKLNAIKEHGGSEVFMMLTDEKCNAFESWAEDLILPVDEDPWGFKNTPMPELGPKKREEIEREAMDMAMQMLQDDVAQAAQQGQQLSQEQLMQMAQQKTQQVMKEVEDIVVEAGQKEKEDLQKYLSDYVVKSSWRESIVEVINDLSTYPAAFLKGPFVKREPRLQWGDDGTPVIRDDFTVNFERVSPFNLYPAPSARNIDDGYLLEYHEMTVRDLEALKGVEGYDDNAIDRVLENAGAGFISGWLWRGSHCEADMLQGRDHTWDDPDKKIEALQFWGDLQGLRLLEWGIDPNDIDDPLASYQTEVWLVGDEVIKAELNGDPLGRKPYFKASFRARNGQFWGKGLPELIVDIQNTCNASARALINNMSIASGPQVGVDIGSVADGEDVTDMYPWKIWQFDMSKDTFNRDPIWFFQPNSVVNDLMAIYNQFSVEADNKSGIPKYSYGAGGGGGASETASGFSMMMNNASRGVKKVLSNVDNGIIRKSIERLYEFLMLYDEKLSEYYQGDIEIVARGSTELLAKEQQQVRRNELLQIVLQSPIAKEIVGVPGIAEIFREVVKGLNIGLTDVVPTKEQMKAQQTREMIREQLMMQQQMQDVGQAQQMAAQGKGSVPPKKGPQTALSGARAGGADANTAQNQITGR